MVKKYDVFECDIPSPPGEEVISQRRVYTHIIWSNSGVVGFRLVVEPLSREGLECVESIGIGGGGFALEAREYHDVKERLKAGEDPKTISQEYIDWAYSQEGSDTAKC